MVSLNADILKDVVDIKVPNDDTGTPPPEIGENPRFISLKDLSAGKGKLKESGENRENTARLG